MTKISFDKAVDEARNERFIISPRAKHPYVCIYTPCRVDEHTVPAGWYVYEIRTDDDGKGLPATIEEHVLVNFGGSLLSHGKIKFADGKDYFDLYNNKRWGGYKYDYITKSKLPKRLRTE